MTSEERSLIQDLRAGKLTAEQFLKLFRPSIDREELGMLLLKEAAEEKSGTDLQLALAVSLRFGWSPSPFLIFCQLAGDSWHYSHEDIISLLDEFRDPRAIDMLYQATQYIPEYLEYDEARALAVKAIWALGKIRHPEADKKLALLAKSEDHTIKANALTQIDRRSKGIFDIVHRRLNHK